MADRFVYRFDWDAVKAAGNRRKHGVDFETAATVFRDPLALSVVDDAHGRWERRWITLGQAGNGMLLVVVHTFEESDRAGAHVRLISARPATAHERQQYESN